MNLPQRPERNPDFVFSPTSTERSTTLLVVWIAIMMMSVNGILPLIKSSLNGTTRFHGEIKNTKLIFKRYLTALKSQTVPVSDEKQHPIL